MSSHCRISSKAYAVSCCNAQFLMIPNFSATWLNYQSIRSLTLCYLHIYTLGQWHLNCSNITLCKVKWSLLYENILYLNRNPISAQIEVKVRLPRFKIELGLDMIPTLKALGIKDLFSDGTADLTNIANSNEMLYGLFHLRFKDFISQ